MLSITLNKIVMQCAGEVHLAAGKKKPHTEEAIRNILVSIWDAYKRGRNPEPIHRSFIVSGQVKACIKLYKEELGRHLPTCERIAELATRARHRRTLDRCSRISMGLSGVALLIPINEEQSPLTSRPAILAMGGVVAAYAFQSFKHWQFPHAEAERRELRELWLALDNEIPENLEEASELMRVEMVYAKAVVDYASIRLRVTP